MTANLLEDIKSYLVNVAGITDPVYMSELPDPIPGAVPETVVAIYEYSGMGPLWVQPQSQSDPRTPRYRRPRVQCNVRGNQDDYMSAQVLADTVYDAFCHIMNMALTSGVFYQAVTPLQEPFPLKWDDNRRPLFTFNAEVFLTP